MSAKQPAVQDPFRGLQGFLFLDMLVRLFIWSSSLAVTILLMSRLDIWQFGWHTRPQWADLIQVSGLFVALVVTFNVLYVLMIVGLCFIIPTPREGRYSLGPGELPDKQLIWACLLATLTKARYEAPFPGFLVFQVANMPVIRWLMQNTLGPKSKSCYVTDPTFPDPYGLEIGRNVVFGMGCAVAAHAQGRGEIIIKKTVIGNDVIIGGNVIVYCGCRIGDGAVLLGGAVLRPDTFIGNNEVWGGVPARKIKTLAPFGDVGQTDEDAPASERPADDPSAE